MAEGIANWNPYSTRVQGGLADGNFVNASYCIVCAGPPFFNQTVVPQGASGRELAKSLLYPIGLLQNFSIGQNQNIARLFEIGSRRSYFITGHAIAQVQLGRVLYHGESLLRTLYAYYDTRADNSVGSVKIRPLIEPGGVVGSVPFMTGQPNQRAPGLASIKVAPGYDNVFMNLASNLFAQPTGLMVIMQDNAGNNVAAFYIENCLVPSYGFGFDGQGLVIQEQCSVQCERIQPIRLAQLGLVNTLRQPDQSGIAQLQGIA